MGILRCAALALALVAAAPAQAASRSLWNDYVAEASARFGVPDVWIWRVMAIESGGRTTLDGRPIRSPKGAIGLMQLMPGTWRAMRDTYGLGADPDDPRDNILAGTAYLRLMYERFGYPGLFAAYNAGPGRYAAYVSGAQRLPGETRAYLLQTAGRTDGKTVADGRASLRGQEALQRVFAISRPLADAPPKRADSAPAREDNGLIVIHHE